MLNPEKKSSQQEIKASPQPKIYKELYDLYALIQRNSSQDDNDENIDETYRYDITNMILLIAKKLRAYSDETLSFCTPEIADLEKVMQGIQATFENSYIHAINDYEILLNRLRQSFVQIEEKASIPPEKRQELEPTFESKFAELGLEKHSYFTRALPEQYIFEDEEGHYILSFAEVGRLVHKGSSSIYVSNIFGLPVTPNKNNYYSRYGKPVYISKETIKSVSTDVNMLAGSEALGYFFAIPEGVKVRVEIDED